MSKRLFFILALFAICSTGTYYFFKSNSQGDTEQALLYVLENNYAAAEKALFRLPSSQPLWLFKAYLEHARGHYLESSFYLSSILNDPSKRLKGELAVETLLLQGANGYFEGREELLSSSVDRVLELAPHHPFLCFFTGLNHYLHAAYKEAFQEWSTFEMGQKNGGTGWMGPILDKIFPLSWRRIHRAHCLTEMGDLLTAREILEKEIHNREYAQLATLFLGFTYLKESALISLDQRGSYFKLARFYFERGGIAEAFERERRLLMKSVAHEAEALILSDLDEEKLRWGFEFVHTLQGWRANETIETLAHKLAEKILHETQERPLLCQIVRQEFLGSPFHLLLTQKLLDAIAFNMKHNKSDALYEAWSKLEALSPATKGMTKHIAELTSAEVFRAIKEDSQALTSTRRYLAFWEKLGRSGEEKERLAQELMMHAKLFWQQEHQEKKGEQLMQLALDFTLHKEALENQISSFLKALYCLAEESNLIDRLMFIFDAMDRFGINKQEIATPSKIANHLADAEYLYHAQNYLHAKAHALWTLKLDPKNQQAQRLVGLACFHLGEYAQAYIVLNKLSNLDENAHKALMFSQVFSSQEQEDHLCQFDSLESE